MGSAALGPAGVGVGAASSVLGFLGGQHDAAEQRVQDLQNQDLANYAAADALARGNQAAGRTRMQGTETIAAQKVAYATSGVDPTSGSAAEVMADTRMMSELDARTQENNAAREAWGYKTQGLNYGKQAELATARGINAGAGTLLGGVGSVLGGIGRLKGNA